MGPALARSGEATQKATKELNSWVDLLVSTCCWALSKASELSFSLLELLPCHVKGAAIWYVFARMPFVELARTADRDSSGIVTGKGLIPKGICTWIANVFPGCCNYGFQEAIGFHTGYGLLLLGELQKLPTRAAHTHMKTNMQGMLGLPPPLHCQGPALPLAGQRLGLGLRVQGKHPGKVQVGLDLKVGCWVGSQEVW